MAAKATKIGNLRAAAYVVVVKSDAATGRATVSFPAGLFKKAPVVVATGVTPDDRDIAISLVGDPTTTSVVVQARKTRKLPLTGLLSAVLGFDVLEPVAANIHVVAFAQ